MHMHSALVHIHITGTLWRMTNKKHYFPEKMTEALTVIHCKTTTTTNFLFSSIKAEIIGFYVMLVVLHIMTTIIGLCRD